MRRMNSKIVNLSLIFIGLLLINACSEEDEDENNLWRVSGRSTSSFLRNEHNNTMLTGLDFEDCKLNNDCGKLYFKLYFNYNDYRNKKNEVLFEHPFNKIHKTSKGKFKLEYGSDIKNKFPNKFFNENHLYLIYFDYPNEDEFPDSLYITALSYKN